MQSKKTIIVSPLLQHLETVDYKELCDFQGDLKILPDENLEKLKLSLIENGIFVPKYVWKNEQSRLMLIDGNQTKKALGSLELEGWKIPKIPYVSIPANNEKEAAEKLLIINSKFGVYNVNTEFAEKFKIDRIELLKRIDIPELNYQWSNVDSKTLLKEIDERKDLSEKLKNVYEVIVSCDSETHQKEVYEFIQSEGYQCRLLTL